MKKTRFISPCALLRRLLTDSLNLSHPSRIRWRPAVDHSFERFYRRIGHTESTIKVIMAWMHKFCASYSFSKIGPSIGCRIPSMSPSRARTTGR